MKTKRTLRHKPSPQQQLTFWHVAGGIALAMLVGIGAFFYLNVGTSINSMAGPGDDHTSVVDLGDWTDGSTWDTDPTAPGTTGINLDIEIAANDTVYLVGNLSYGNGGNTLTVNGLLLIDGNLTMGDNTEVVVGSNGVLVVTGSLSSESNSDITNNGIIAVRYDLTMESNGKYTGTGELFAGGTVSGKPGANGVQGEEQPLGNLNPDNSDIHDMVTNGISALPVTLVYFKAEVQGDLVVLRWETAEEINNDFFTIERSADGRFFESVAILPGAGNSQQPQSYSHVDANPLPGVSYYRLKQTDFDGKYERFKAVAVFRQRMEADAAPVVHSTAPNPFMNSFRVAYEVPAAGPVRLQLRDFNGTVVASEAVEAIAGHNEYHFERIDYLKSGVYLLTLSAASYPSQTVRVIKR